MAKFIKKTWAPQTDRAVPRSQRGACSYECYLPDLLMDRAFQLNGTVAADVADAETALTRLDSSVGALADTEALARILLRAESVASSRIEGLEIGPRRLLRAEAAQQMGVTASDVGAEDVLGNIYAMREAINLGQIPGRITREHILDIHRRLMDRSRLGHYAGVIRSQQNWIGGSNHNPCRADFVPPAPDQVSRLLDDLCEFISDDSLPAVAQAAIAHAQFETIHPFVDGNGRTGRALIYLVLRRRGLICRALPPISLVLATRSLDYIGGLIAFRHIGSPDSPAALSGVNQWVATFASACSEAATRAESFEHLCADIESRWRQQVGRVRAGSTVDLLIRTLPGMPIVNVKGLAGALGKSFPQVNDAIARLERVGILTQVTVGRRNRAFEAREIIDAVADLERQLASPAGDTMAAPPVRPVPRGSRP